MNVLGPQERHELLTELFGESDDYGEMEASTSGRDVLPWSLEANQEVDAISGLHVFRDFLSQEQQKSLLQNLVANDYLTTGEKASNQAMRFFGTAALPGWLEELCSRARINLARGLAILRVASTAEHTDVTAANNNARADRRYGRRRSLTGPKPSLAGRRSSISAS